MKRPGSPRSWRPTSQRIGYVRVSSADQNDARQLEGLELEKIFTDKASGKDTNRPQLQAMLSHVRDGDHLHVHSMNQLWRSLVDLQHVVESLTTKGATVHFLRENLTFQKPGSGDDSHEAAYSMLMLQMLGAVGQFERALIKERQREGVAIAKTKDVYKGRKPSLDAAAIVTLKEMAASGMPKVDIATALGIARASVYEYLKT